MDRLASAALVIALLVVSVTSAAAPAAGDDPRASLTTQGEFDEVEFHITVYENASARWTFQYRRTLANESERQQFEAFADRFNGNETELYRDFVSRAEQLTARGTNVTGREMEARGFSKRAYTTGTGVEDNLGVVRMSFRWTAFAASDGDSLVVGDVFQDGLYIGPDQKFVVEEGPNLRITSAQPDPSSTSSDAVTWEGERSFNDERPRVTFGPADATTGTTADSPSVTDSSTPGAGNGPDGLLPVFALLALVALGGGAAYAYRSGALGGGTATTDTGDDGGGGAAASNPEPAISDEELLSDEDRVMRMLEERGGRMKQVNIVEETGWSKSKVSMLLSDMEDEGEISKLRVGRENIVSIAGQEPDAAGSPFEDDE
ncbi:helix-turn-helix transcriptional regulator [Halorarius halobius]|uniref:helix-turn-helix transcriptional regulator n=1 Tax=Halorarius halobius TaxID=2962671 RepID=UPI0020CBC378|nr:helix-turn-helix domain-containing protein [Halorarius halobius]